MTAATKGHTMIQIDNVATRITLGRDARYGTMEVEPERFSPEVQRYIYDYGLRQVLNDAMAEKFEKDKKGEFVLDNHGNRIMLSDDVIRAKAEKRLDALYAGTIRTRGEEPTNPIEAEVHAIAKDAINMAYKRAGLYAAVPKGTKNRMLWLASARAVMRGEKPIEDEADMVARYLARLPDEGAGIRERAERNVAERTADIESVV